MYGKLFDSMYDGTLYGKWQAIVTFQQMIVLCDADGVVDMTPQAMAARTSIPLDIIMHGLKDLSEVDPYSRSPDQDGRRIELLDAHRPWGWHIVNHEKYKRLQDADTVREQNRERQQRHREKKSAEKRNGSSRTVTDSNVRSRHTDTDTDTPSVTPNGVTARGVDPIKDEIWDKGRALLEGEGMSKDRAGSYLGKLMKAWGQNLLIEAVRDAWESRPLKPSDWIVARCQQRRNQQGSRQAGIEARNAEAAREVSRRLGLDDDDQSKQG